MDHLKILKRAWEIIWRYRALWLFGIILALAVSQGGSGNASWSGGGGGGGGNGAAPFDAPYGPPPRDWHVPGALIVVIVIAVLLLILLAIVIIGIVVAFLGYLARTALIRMVDDYEVNGERRSIGWGFKAGWSVGTWRIFLINLLTGIPLFIVGFVSVMIALFPLLFWLTGAPALGILGTVGTVGIMGLLALILIPATTLVRLLREFFWREAILQDKGVFPAIESGWQLFKANVVDTLIMWVLVLGVRIVTGLMLVPVAIFLFIVVGIVVGIPALLIGLVLWALFGVAGAVLWAIPAIILFFLFVGLPMLFLKGVIEAYKSTVWTLTYRELRTLEVGVE